MSPEIAVCRRRSRVGDRVVGDRDQEIAELAVVATAIINAAIIYAERWVQRIGFRGLARKMVKLGMVIRTC